MSSRRKIAANRRNAQASTGPKTARGKAHAARNARRHGLSLSVIADPMLSEQVAVFAREIAGETSDDNIFQLARRVAEAQIDLVRVRRARHELFIRNINDPNYISVEAASRAYKTIIKFARENGIDAPISADLMKLDQSITPQGSQKVASILADFRKELVSFDRYERRALSRRKFAIRALDLARET
jgi:hypothetical protein